MQNKTEKDEWIYFEKILDKIRDAIRQTTEAVNDHIKNVKENKEYLYENKDGMDHAEKINVRQSIDNIGMIGEKTAEKKSWLNRLFDMPYFGRIDFKKKDSARPEPIYVGVHTFLDEEENENLIYDWRAPMSNMFYDFELGPAQYESPGVTTEGRSH